MLSSILGGSLEVQLLAAIPFFFDATDLSISVSHSLVKHMHQKDEVGERNPPGPGEQSPTKSSPSSRICVSDQDHRLQSATAVSDCGQRRQSGWWRTRLLRGTYKDTRTTHRPGRGEAGTTEGSWGERDDPARPTQQLRMGDPARRRRWEPEGTQLDSIPYVGHLPEGSCGELENWSPPEKDALIRTGHPCRESQGKDLPGGTRLVSSPSGEHRHVIGQDPEGDRAPSCWDLSYLGPLPSNNYVPHHGTKTKRYK